MQMEIRSRDCNDGNSAGTNVTVAVNKAIEEFEDNIISNRHRKIVIISSCVDTGPDNHCTEFTDPNIFVDDNEVEVTIVNIISDDGSINIGNKDTNLECLTENDPNRIMSSSSTAPEDILNIIDEFWMEICEQPTSDPTSDPTYMPSTSPTYSSCDLNGRAIDTVIGWDVVIGSNNDNNYYPFTSFKHEVTETIDIIDYYSDLDSVNSDIKEIDSSIMISGNMIFCDDEENELCDVSNKIGPKNHAFIQYAPIAINTNFNLDNIVIHKNESNTEEITIYALINAISGIHDTIPIWDVIHQEIIQMDINIQYVLYQIIMVY